MSPSNAQRAIPRSVIRRFPQYLWRVQELRESGLEWVSSQSLADALGFTSSTVRQDLSHLDFSGVAKRGYQTAHLEQVLSQFLGAAKGRRAVIVGAGNLGRALAMHQEFARHGFQIVGLFDSAPAVVGTKVGPLTVQPMSKLPALVRSKQIEIGLIAVPPTAAQAVADELVAAGVRGLLNLAPTHVRTAKRLPLVDARIVQSMLELSCAIERKSLARNN
ncbi:MAG: redox-sensing transcriptional repressor Rex [Kiritimatiellae bacterium]|nr:redox-sensing transcriptional repressor Rex [Kiritimatiellia bacterium]